VNDSRRSKDEHLRIHAPELLINDGLPHTRTGGMVSPILLLHMNLEYLRFTRCAFPF
jgi:hypothetical protein